MKKEKFSKKLSLKKEILSNLSQRRTVGAGVPTTLTIQYPDPMHTWVCIHTLPETDCATC